MEEPDDLHLFGMTMNKRELVRLLAREAMLGVAQAARAVDGLFDAKRGIIPAQIRAGGRVQVSGFGTFEPRQRPARTGRNPRTGKELSIPASVSPAFRPAPALKDAVLAGPLPASAGEGEP
jgi:DNA-binding protein HU-beta